MEKTSHADIRIKRVIGGEEVFFVGFMHDDDECEYVGSEIMLVRVRAAGFEPINDSEYLNRNCSDWANDHELAPYHVITNEQIRSGSKDLLCCFFDYDRERYWYGLGAPFSRNGLVACHRAS